MPDPIVDVRCTTCFRHERWAPDGSQAVLVEGGRRRPKAPVHRTTWAVLRAWQTGGPPVVGVCDACGQPVVSDTPGAAPLTGWTIEFPEHTVTIGTWLTVAKRGDEPKRATIEEVDALIANRSAAAAAAEFIGPPRALPFVFMAVVMVLVLVLLWFFTASFFLNFVWQGFTTGGFAGAIS